MMQTNLSKNGYDLTTDQLFNMKADSTELGCWITITGKLQCQSIKWFWSDD